MMGPHKKMQPETEEQQRARLVSAPVDVEFVHFEGLERTSPQFLEDEYAAQGVQSATSLEALLDACVRAQKVHDTLGVFKAAEIDLRPGKSEKEVRVYVNVAEKNLVGIQTGIEHNGSEAFGVRIFMLFGFWKE